MDAWEATKVLFDRVRVLDPGNASRIMAMLLNQDNCDKELIRLALGPEHLLHEYVINNHMELTGKPLSPSSSMLQPLHMGQPWGMSINRGQNQSLFYSDKYDLWSPASGRHHWSSSLSAAEEVAASSSWRPCLFFARGNCRNGSSCRFLHGLPEDDVIATEREMEVMQINALPLVRPQNLMPSAFPLSSSANGINWLLQQQQNKPQRATLLLGGEDVHRFPITALHSPWMHHNDNSMNPAARQIYMTFTADSNFSEEEVSNYFRIYGPVQDVRIPYQEKRMFGFVTFVCADSVRIVLAKGNPHFVSGARVLVKPYKEKGKVSKRRLQQPDHGEFASCMAPTRLFDSRDPFGLQQPQIGPRIMYGNLPNQGEVFFMKKFEERHQVTELQQDIELQRSRLLGLQLHNLRSKGHYMASSMSRGQTNGNLVSSSISSTTGKGKQEEQQEDGDDDIPKHAINSGKEETRESGPRVLSPEFTYRFQDSDVEYNLPESPFSSPSKASFDVIAQCGSSSSSLHQGASSIFSSASTLELPTFDSCFFQLPRRTPGCGAIGGEYRAKRV